MSKFKVGDHVRVTSPMATHFDEVGAVVAITEHSRWPVKVKMIKEMPYGQTLLYKESALTLADPDVHTVLDQMDAEGAPSPTAGLEKLVDDVYAARSKGAVDPTPNRRAQVLRTAESLVNGQRADDYGPPAENFGRVAAMWSAQFAAKLNEPLTADEVAIALVHLKLSRLANTPDHADSWIDLCGYAALGAEIADGS